MKLSEILKFELSIKRGWFLLRLLKFVMLYPEKRFIFTLRLFEYSARKGYRIIKLWAANYMKTRYGCYIERRAKIGVGVKFPHPNGIVIGKSTIIGENCTIYQQVTFGGKRVGDAKKNNYPIIGNNVTIFAGAKIIGGVKIGNNVIVGTNSVVNKDVPDDKVVAGIPAKIIN